MLAPVLLCSLELSHLYDVVSCSIAQVSAPDLRPHVPAVEGAGGELESAHVKHHVGDGRDAVPAVTKVSEPVVPVTGKPCEGCEQVCVYVCVCVCVCVRVCLHVLK